MMSRTVTSTSLPVHVSLDEVQHFVFEDATWALYESLLREVGDRSLRMTYDQGRLEIMSPLPEHERPNQFIGRMIEWLSFELRMSVCSLGSTTLRRKDKAKGLEPDKCYYFRNAALMRGRKRLRKSDPPPELAVEIDITSRSVPREPIYAALGVPELWRYDGADLDCLHLINGRYRRRKFSIAFHFLEPAKLTTFLDRLETEDENAVLRDFVEWIRKNGWIRE